MVYTAKFDMKPSDAAWQPDGTEGYFVLWDAYAFFNEGYKCLIQLYSSPCYPWVEYRDGELNNPLCVLIIVTPDGVSHMSHISYPVSSFRASKEKMDVTVGDNRMLGRYDSKGKYEGMYAKILGDKIAAELTFRVKLGAVTLSDRDDNLMYYNPVTNKYLGIFYLGTKSVVEGTLTLNGKSIKVTGIGHNNYNKGNVKIPDILSRWFYSFSYAGDYSLICMHSTALKRHKYQHFTRLVLLDNNDVVMSSNRCATYGEEYNIDTVTGGPYPVEETLRAVEDDTELSVYFPRGVMAENSRFVNVPGFPFTLENPGFHFFQYSDAHLVIKRNGKTEKLGGQAVREFGWVQKWFPYSR